MTPESRKMFNTYMGSFLIFLALVCFGLAAYMIFMPAKEKSAPLPTVAAISKQPCIEGLTALGLTAISVGEDIQVTDRHAEVPPLERLRTASLGVSMCHLYMKTFCMGPACPDPSALSFTLTPNEHVSSDGPTSPAPAPKKSAVSPADTAQAPQGETAPGAAAPPGWAVPELPPEMPPQG